jgi:hypothetical protein
LDQTLHSVRRQAASERNGRDGGGGVIPVEITAQIANAFLEQIEQWFDTAIDSPLLTDVSFQCSSQIFSCGNLHQ